MFQKKKKSCYKANKKLEKLCNVKKINKKNYLVEHHKASMLTGNRLFS